MENVIREGELRLLAKNENSCDVILSCQGRRIMAHKLILSMASPVFRALLLEDSSDPTVIIFPDIASNTMSLIMDYIYTGSVVVYSRNLKDFLAVADLLRIFIEVDPDGDKTKMNKEEVQKEEISLETNSSSDPDIYSRKNQRKLPILLPIGKMKSDEKVKMQKGLCGYVSPSPWCPRVERVFGDPRNDCLEESEHLVLSSQDRNNNFQPQKFFKYFYGPNICRPYESSSKAYRCENELPNTSNRIFDPYTLGKFKKISRLSTSKNNSNIANEKNIGQLNSKYEDSKIDTTNISSTDTADITSLKLEQDSQASDQGSMTSPRPADVKKPPEIPSILLGEVNTSEESLNASLSSNESTGDVSNHSFNNNDEKLIEKEDKDQKFRSYKPYKCEECGKSFSQMRNYKYHRSVHEGTKEFAAKCAECGKSFNDKGYLSSHMKIHRDKKEYACPHCPKRFNQRVAYNMHLRIHTGVKPHECLTCGKSFSRKMLLKQHQRVHTGERPYSCPECGKTFADRSNMSLHSRLHSGVKPYACSVCPKSFTKKHHLKTHMNFHTGLKPYTCQKCGLAFSQSSNMRTHFKKCLLKGQGERAGLKESLEAELKDDN